MRCNSVEMLIYFNIKPALIAQTGTSVSVTFSTFQDIIEYMNIRAVSASVSHCSGAQVAFFATLSALCVLVSKVMFTAASVFCFGHIKKVAGWRDRAGETPHANPPQTVSHTPLA